MSLEIQQEMDGKLLTVHLSGKLHKEDYQHFLPVVEQAIAKQGKLRMLVDMDDFHGWSAGGLWEDIKFDFKHYRDIERLALVGEAHWEKWMATVCKPFTSATIRYFPRQELTAAQSWVAA